MSSRVSHTTIACHDAFTLASWQKQVLADGNFTCAALAVISPISTGFDVANVAVDTVQGDWGEAGLVLQPWGSPPGWVVLRRTFKTWASASTGSRPS